MKPAEIKQKSSLSSFKGEIKKWIPENCPCRICKEYFLGVGFIFLHIFFYYSFFLPLFSYTFCFVFLIVHIIIILSCFSFFETCLFLVDFD